MRNTVDVMYEEIVNGLKADNKYYGNSVIISFLKMTSNKRINYLRTTSCTSGAFGSGYQNLLDEGMIANSGEEDKYCLTAKSIWNKEKEALFNDGTMLAYLEDKVFPQYRAKNTLKDREKLVVMFLLICRAVDENTQLDLLCNATILDNCEELLIKVYELLNSIGVITKMKKDSIFSKQGNEHKVAYMFRQTDAIPKTGVPFKATGARNYYVDITDKNGISEKKLKAVLKKVLGRDRELTFEETNKIRTSMNDLTRKYAVYINENNDNPYLGIDVDKVIKKSLEYLYD